MAEYHISCGLAGIYAGVLKNKEEWKDKTECTDEAIEAVRDYMVDELLGGLNCSKSNKGGYSWKLKDGRYVNLKIEKGNRQQGGYLKGYEEKATPTGQSVGVVFLRLKVGFTNEIYS